MALRGGTRRSGRGEGVMGRQVAGDEVGEVAFGARSATTNAVTALPRRSIPRDACWREGVQDRRCGAAAPANPSTLPPPPAGPATATAVPTAAPSGAPAYTWSAHLPAYHRIRADQSQSRRTR